MKKVFLILFVAIFPLFASAQLSKGKYRISMFSLRSTDGKEIGFGKIEGDKSFVRVTETIMAFYFDGYPAFFLTYSDKPKKTENGQLVYECYNTETDKPVLFLLEKVAPLENTYSITIMKSDNRFEVFGIHKVE